MARKIVYPRCICYSRMQSIIIIIGRRPKLAWVNFPFPKSNDSSLLLCFAAERRAGIKGQYKVKANLYIHMGDV
ncbi:hypothetical protein D0864_01609 [Hortaea werneckii]|uniref:Uncharacterized protein n=1 Tax=Hortaea werneckii TaxID=91943 RepID=A0A3M7H7D0_HORWE|nr:hypothetical protein D0864_01609 [Hortaea werneckii]